MTTKDFGNSEVRRDVMALRLTESERATALHTLRIAEAFANAVVGARDAVSRWFK